jgi:hypothetical protein
MWVAKLCAVAADGFPVNSAFLQAPHLAFSAGLSSGTRLTAAQWGQTICMEGKWGGAAQVAMDA